MTSTLKALSALLPTSQATTQSDNPISPAAHEMLAEVACASLDGLDCLRAALKTKGLELEVQRYGFIRRFATAGLHHHVLSQGWKLRGFLQAAQDSSGSSSAPGKDLVELQSATTLSLLTALSEVLTWPVDDQRMHAPSQGPTGLRDPLDMLRDVLTGLRDSLSPASAPVSHLIKV